MYKTPEIKEPTNTNTELNPAEIDLVFKMDITDILGIDLWSLILDIDMMKRHPNYQILDNPLYLEIRSLVQDNISEIISTYLKYQPDKFPNPLDQYKWIAQSEMEIRLLLGRGLDVPFDTTLNEDGTVAEEGEPLKHYQNTYLY